MDCMICGERPAEIFLYDLETHACMECYDRLEGG